MALTLGDNFSYQGAKPLDGRLKYDTLAAMKAVADATMYDGCMAYCAETEKTYQWKSSNTVDASTGKWREFSSGGGGVTNYNDLENRPQIEGVTLTGNKTAADLGLAKANQIPTVPTKVSQLQNDSGFITDSALPGVYEGDTAGLVPAAGSDNEGKYLDNDGNWTVVPMPMIGTINRSDIYDTTEKVVGKWTDGRPVYQKTLKAVQLSKSGVIWESHTPHGILYLNEIIDINAVGVAGFKATYVSIASNTGELSSYLITYRVGDDVIIKSTNDRSSADFYITLKYTKTTDAANSYNYADENDYSTSEKIIGKWIDGKTLYQKTIQTTMPTVTTDGVEANGARILVDVNIDRFISAVGTVRYENNDMFLPETRLKDTSDPSKGCYTMRIACITGAHPTAAYRGTFMIKSNYATLNGCTAYVTLKYTKTT